MSKLEILLRHQYEGSITPAEQAELDLLTHRQQVIAGAESRARAICRRRRGTVAAVCALLLVSGTLLLSLGQQPRISSMPNMASTDVPQVVSVTSEPASTQEVTIAQAAVGRTTHSKAAEPQVNRHDSTPAMPMRQVVEIEEQYVEELAPEVLPAAEPIVVCNTQCSPDSVINDIWKFLRA